MLNSTSTRTPAKKKDPLSPRQRLGLEIADARETARGWARIDGLLTKQERDDKEAAFAHLNGLLLRLDAMPPAPNRFPNDPPSVVDAARRRRAACSDALLCAGYNVQETPLGAIVRRGLRTVGSLRWTLDGEGVCDVGCDPGVVETVLKVVYPT